MSADEKVVNNNLKAFAERVPEQIHKLREGLAFVELPVNTPEYFISAAFRSPEMWETCARGPSGLTKLSERLEQMM